MRKGREDLIGNALKWWGYDKQLYLLKRIARTEMATAAHRAVIASASDDDTIIGFQWRLSSSHPEPDICDYYASIDMGLGKGVWTKDAVPQHKAHPHCMCLLVPRVTPVKTPGSQNYAEFIKGVSPERRGQLLPKWSQHLTGLGMPLDKLMREDGLGLVTREALKQIMGEERFQAANALGKAAVDTDYGRKDLTTHKVKTAKLLADLAPLRTHKEVDRFVRQVESNPGNVDSRLQHYIKRKYQDGAWMGSIAEFDDLFKEPLNKSKISAIFASRQKVGGEKAQCG